MKKITTICDICKEGDALRFEYQTGKYADASGNGYNGKWESVDVCHNCAMQLLKLLPRSIPNYLKKGFWEVLKLD